jgi:predicted PurR-regulated permease PerM
VAEGLGRDLPRVEKAADAAGSPAQQADAAARQATGSPSTAHESSQRTERAADSVEHTVQEPLEDIPDDDPLLEPETYQAVAGVDDEHPLGRPGERLRGFSPFRIAFFATLGVGVAYEILHAVVLARQVLVLVVVALFLAVGLNPAVEWLGHRMRRTIAVTVVIGAMVGLFGGFVAAAVPPISKQATALADDTPGYLDRLRNDNSVVRDLDNRFHFINTVKERVDKGPTFGVGAINGVIGIGKAVVSAVFAVLTVFILTIYFLANFPEIKRWSLRLVPRSRRPRVGLIADEALRRVGGYVLGNLATSVVAGITALIFLEILRVPYAVALALFVAVLDLVPLVGATIAAVIVSAVALFHSLPVGIATIIFFVIYQQFENYVLVPRIMKRTAEVSPLATVVAALIGGTLLGIVGALLAIPVAAAIQIVVDEVVVPRQDDA